MVCTRFVTADGLLGLFFVGSHERPENRYGNGDDEGGGLQLPTFLDSRWGRQPSLSCQAKAARRSRFAAKPGCR
jgi:hypothetical protein